LGETRRVSVASNGAEVDEWVEMFAEPAISADGRWVAFESFASHLVTGDTNDSSDIFVHDHQTGETRRVSVASSGSEGNGSAHNPAISADGRWVVFDSFASNLVPGDTNGIDDVFVHDNQGYSSLLPLVRR
jgi:Tol biopolymer transport system component